jgi:hypothetical protein
MKKILMLAMVLGLLMGGCASIPANFNERATSELKIDIKLYSKSTYLPGEYGFSIYSGDGGNPSPSGEAKFCEMVDMTSS